MRRARLATPIALLCLIAAGCGGAKVAVQDAPGGTAGLTISGGTALAPQATATATSSTAATVTPTATATPATNTQTAAPTATPTQSAPTGTAGGGTAAPTGQATPPPGTDPQKFEAFCQQNPGAC